MTYLSFVGGGMAENDGEDEFARIFKIWDKQDVAGFTEDQIEFGELGEDQSFYRVGDQSRERYLKKLIDLFVDGYEAQGNAIRVSDQEPVFIQPYQLVVRLF